jgi:hypothetical protein
VPLALIAGLAIGEKQALTQTGTDISNKQKERMTNYFIATLL